MSPNWATILGGLLSGTLLIDPLNQIYKYFTRKYIAKKNKKATQDTIDIVFKVFRPVLRNTDVRRVKLLKAHNGGGFLNPKSPYKISVLLEDYSQGLPSVINDIQDKRIDLHYIELLNEMFTNSSVEVITSDLPECLLRTNYAATKVAATQFHLIESGDREVYYLAFNSNHKDCFKKTSTKYEIENAVSNCQKIMKKY